VVVDDITIGPRLRQVSDILVQDTAKSMAERGQLAPIAVRSVDDKIVLIAGLTRLRAAKLLGWKWIGAVIRDVDDIDAELIEIDENLIRKDLTIEERNAHIRRKRDLLLKPQETAGASCATSLVDGRKAGQQHQKGVASQLAEEVGLTKSQVNRILAEPKPKPPAAKVVMFPKTDAGKSTKAPADAGIDGNEDAGKKPKKKLTPAEVVKAKLLEASAALGKDARKALRAVETGDNKLDLDDNEKWALDNVRRFARQLRAMAGIVSVGTLLWEVLRDIEEIERRQVEIQTDDLDVLNQVAVRAELIEKACAERRRSSSTSANDLIEDGGHDLSDISKIEPEDADDPLPPAAPVRRKPREGCRQCGGTGVIVGKTGTAFDCDCMRGDDEDLDIPDHFVRRTRH
jgi:ParB family chromosome partitioning protein